jgi:hypothetical protein
VVGSSARFDCCRAELEGGEVRNIESDDSENVRTEDGDTE